MKRGDRSKTKIMDMITKWYRTKGYPPTLRELAIATGLRSTWTVRYHLKSLQAAGMVKLTTQQSRGIMLTSRGDDDVSPFIPHGKTGIPLVGRISAGRPILAVENIETYINFAQLFTQDPGIFALRVKGDSMTGAGICDNDVVFVKPQPTAVNGDIVAALLPEDNEAVIKRYRPKKDCVELISENPEYKPIVTTNIKILGKILMVLRQYKK
ncbi:MAG: transcriptional repressor LexA [Elusimicrobiota bacterium]